MWISVSTRPSIVKRSACTAGATRYFEGGHFFTAWPLIMAPTLFPIPVLTLMLQSVCTQAAARQCLLKRVR
jgi:hypothetical protein